MVARREIVTRGTSKSYLIGLAASTILIAALVVLPSLLDSESEYRVALTGTDSAEMEAAITGAEQGFEGFTVVVEQVDDAEAARAVVTAGDVDAAVIDNETLLSESGVSSDLGLVLDAAHQQVMAQRQLADAGYDPEAVSAALTVEPFQQERLEGSDMGARSAIGYISCWSCSSCS